MLSDIGIQMVLVDKVSGSGGEAVEIWIWNQGVTITTHPAADKAMDE